MSKRVFISHCSDESQLAEALRKSLNNAFKGDLEFFALESDIRSGDNWPKYLAEALNGTDAGLFLLTPQYLRRPLWLVAEFMAFWLKLAERDSQQVSLYMLSVGNNTEETITELDREKKVFEPIKWSQRAHLENKNEIHRMIEKLHEFAHHGKPEKDIPEIPYTCYDGLFESCMSVYRVLEQMQGGTGGSQTSMDGHWSYIEHSRKWTLSLNGDKQTLRGVCDETRHIRSNSDELSRIPVLVSPSKGLFNLNIEAIEGKGAGLTVLESDYPKDAITVVGPEKKPSEAPRSLEYNIVFTTPLYKGQEVRLHFQYEIPVYKYATSDYKFDMAHQIRDKRMPTDREENLIDVKEDTKKLVYEICLDASCKVRSAHGIAADTNNDVLKAEEEDKIRSLSCYTEEKPGDGSLILRFERENLTRRIKYRFPWSLPEQSYFN